MDGSTLDHSDSDSGDSWTILEPSTTYGDEAPDFSENTLLLKRETTDPNIDKDEDTDGISIISDSEPDTSTPCELILDSCITEENHPTESQAPQYITFNPLPPNSINNHEECIRSEDDFLGHNSGKHKTYVHRRNKRLSTVLNIIMLGSVITAAGVAIGHMWGARNECSIHTTPSINKILSNLYKLQEENTYLRNKLRELTLLSTSLQFHQKKLHTADKIPNRQQRCKRVYEEPLTSKNTDKITKCIDRDVSNDIESIVRKHYVQPEYEKEFIRDIDKLTQIYQQNRSWLDDEIARRLKHERDAIKKMAKSPLSSITEEQRVFQDENTKTQSAIDNNEPEFHITPEAEQLIQMEIDGRNFYINTMTRKITYADSLKSDQHPHKVQKRDIDSAALGTEYRDNVGKKRSNKDKDLVFFDVNFSEEELRKDDRYIGQKHKQDRKKRDRQKLHKKQKRRNKYEQWEMKGGYMKDYDDLSITSFPENENVLKKPDENQLSQTEKIHYINELSEADSSQNINLNNKSKEAKNKKNVEKAGGKNSKNEDVNWYDKRAALRTEARKKLEHELFGETSPNNAGWYFRRMQKREQCRAKSDNSTYKKLLKRNMNFKMKK